LTAPVKRALSQSQSADDGFGVLLPHLRSPNSDQPCCNCRSASNQCSWSWPCSCPRNIQIS
jgi:hypothetical protein